MKDIYFFFCVIKSLKPFQKVICLFTLRLMPFIRGKKNPTKIPKPHIYCPALDVLFFFLHAATLVMTDFYCQLGKKFAC